MAISRVLVLHSVDDPITARRIARLEASPRRENYEFSHAFAMSLASMEARVDEAVRVLRPELVLAHAGLTFHLVPERFAEMLAGISKAYPIKLAADQPDSINYARSSGEAIPFESGEEIRRIVELVF